MPAQFPAYFWSRELIFRTLIGLYAMLAFTIPPSPLGQLSGDLMGAFTSAVKLAYK